MGLKRAKASLCSAEHDEHRHCTDRCSRNHMIAYKFHLQGYAWEITTSEGGWGLDGVLQGVQHKLDGIANGIDTTEWSPETDDHLPASYSAADMSGGFWGVCATAELGCVPVPSGVWMVRLKDGGQCFAVSDMHGAGQF